MLVWLGNFGTLRYENCFRKKLLEMAHNVAFAFCRRMRYDRVSSL